MDHFPRVPSSLQSLDLTGNYSLNFASPLSQSSIKDTNLQDLCSLSLSTTQPICYEDLQTLLEPGRGRLKKFESMYHALETILSSLIQEGYLTEVTELYLRSSSLDDTTAELLAEKLPRLRDLNIASSKVTGVGVKALVLKPGDRLEKLNLTHCTQVSSDAVHYARAKGVNVIYSFPDAKVKGKKVRDW